ncbi:MAG: hypothetical protein ACTSX8_00370 [Alphaproteobacteria bacterium]
MKGTIQPGHVGKNRYELTVVGAPTLVFHEVAGLTSETPTVELPDRTQASGGEEAPGELTVMQPMHHATERAYMEAWLLAGRDPVAPGYKRDATMVWKNIHGVVTATWSLVGLFVSQRVTPDGEMANDGEMADIEWTLKYDATPPL